MLKVQSHFDYAGIVYDSTSKTNFDYKSFKQESLD